jgi:hypothetical protein
MNCKAFFTREVDIRLTEDLSGFVCTARRYMFRRESTTVVLDPNDVCSVEPFPNGDPRHRPYRVVMLRPPQKDKRL